MVFTTQRKNLDYVRRSIDFTPQRQKSPLVTSPMHSPRRGSPLNSILSKRLSSVADIRNSYLNRSFSSKRSMVFSSEKKNRSFVGEKQQIGDCMKILKENQILKSKIEKLNKFQDISIHKQTIEKLIYKITECESSLKQASQKIQRYKSENYHLEIQVANKNQQQKFQEAQYHQREIYIQQQEDIMRQAINILKTEIGQNEKQHKEIEENKQNLEIERKDLIERNKKHEENLGKDYQEMLRVEELQRKLERGKQAIMKMEQDAAYKQKQIDQIQMMYSQFKG